MYFLTKKDSYFEGEIQMSWSINVTGKTQAVMKKVTEDLGKIKCQDPEESIKNKVGEIIMQALEKFPSTVAVTISASGSQWIQEIGITNSLNIKIEPLYGFVE